MDQEAFAIGGPVARGVSVVFAAVSAMPTSCELSEELECLVRAEERGYFLPDEEALVRVRYTQYHVLRSALLEALEELAQGAGDVRKWKERLPFFLTAFAAACLLVRATRFVTDMGKDRPVIWKKFDEADAASGLPRKSFTRLYRAAASRANLRRFLGAADFYFQHREEILRLAGDGVIGPVIRLLEEEEQWIERSRRAALKRLVAYRWFSFLRRNRSAWKVVMFGLFRLSGSVIADLRQPGIKSSGAGKRINASLRDEILAKAKPGDIFVTRHDDAMSNLFLPGFWPHAALYLGGEGGLGALGIGCQPGEDACISFLEAKKDGVRFRESGETLQVDACVLLRSPLGGRELAEAVRRAMSHAGKPYDFLFDFRTSHVLACTEVIYRGFHGIGPVRFALKEVGGRLCLPAEEMLDQAMDCGFRVIATVGIGGDRILTGTKAEVAFHGSRQPF